MGFCNFSLKNVYYLILFCLPVTVCTCVEERCFQPAAHQSGMPTVGMAVGILLTTFLVIGKYISDSRISVLVLRNMNSPKGLPHGLV